MVERRSPKPSVEVRFLVGPPFREGKSRIGSAFRRYYIEMRFRHAVVVALSAGAIVLPLLAHAAGIPFFGPLFPPEANQCAGGFGLLVSVVNNIISFLVTIAIVFVAPLMIAYAGFLFVVNSVNPAGKARAKQVLTNTIVGIVLSLAAWLIVNAIMAVLYNPSTFNTTWYNLISGNARSCIPLAEGLNPVVPATTTPPTVTPLAGDEATVRARLAAAGVSVNNDPCPAGSNGQGCTNVGNMREATVQQIINIAEHLGCTAASRSTCPVVVTGGTEPGHAPGTYSHANGYKVDLRQTAEVNTYLQSFALTGQRGGDSGGPIHEDTCGNQYVQETNHWDITVFRACGGTAENGPPPGGPQPVTCPNTGIQPIHWLGLQGNPFAPFGLYPGQIGSIILPTQAEINAAPNINGATAGRISFGEMPASGPLKNSGSRVEISIAQCPGDFDYWINQPVEVSPTQTNYPCHLDINGNFSYTSVYHSLKSLSQRAAPQYCYTPDSAGPWYVNIRYTYASCPYACQQGDIRCPFTAGCGYSVSWNNEAP